MKLFLHKDEQDNSWYFSLVPFDELEPDDNVIDYPYLNNDLDIIYEILGRKND